MTTSRVHIIKHRDHHPLTYSVCEEDSRSPISELTWENAWEVARKLGATIVVHESLEAAAPFVRLTGPTPA